MVGGNRMSPFPDSPYIPLVGSSQGSGLRKQDVEGLGLTRDGEYESGEGGVWERALSQRDR